MRIMNLSLIKHINTTTPTPFYDYQKKELNIYYVVCEVVVAVLATIGNGLVIYVFHKERRLRRRTNYYIVSLAVADFLVGLLGIPFAILSSIGLPTNLHACIFTVSLLVVLCTISIFCLVAVSVDRYWAILHPMGYSRNVRTKTALVIISICWMAGSLVGFLPLLGWHKDAPTNGSCFFLNVMDYNYLVFLYFGTIITPALILIAFYTHIYQVVLRQLRQVVIVDPDGKGGSGGTMLRMLGAAQKREVKSTQNLAIIVFFFMICWIPLYTINCILAFCRDCHIDSTFMFSCIILSHLNSAGNPLLYAYHLKDFRSALKNFFLNLFNKNDKTPTINLNNKTSFISNHYRNRNSVLDHEKNYRIGSQIYYRKSFQKSKLSSTKQLQTSDINNQQEIVDIWNIPKSFNNSDESLKEINETISIIKPSKPYWINQINNNRKEIRKLSNSSPQLNRTLNYFCRDSDCYNDIDENFKFLRSNSFKYDNKQKLSSIKKIFCDNQLRRSVSTDSTIINKNNYNKTIIQSSCGS